MTPSPSNPDGAADAGPVAPLATATAVWGLALEALPDAALVVDADSGGLRGNRAAHALFGSAVLGVTLDHWQRHHALHVADGSRRFEPDALPIVQALDGRDVDDVEMLVPGEGDRRTWLSVRARPVRRDGRVVGAIASFRDITHHKITELCIEDHQRALKLQHQRQAALAEMELAIVEPRELRLLLDRLVRLTERLLPSGSAAIVVWDESNASFRVGSSTGPRGPSDDALVRRDRGPTPWIITHRRPLAVEDVDADPFGCTNLFRDDDVVAYAGVPLVADEQSIGVLYALDTRPIVRTQEELDFMASVAHRGATAIMRVRLYEQMRRLNESLRDNELELTRHREHLERLVEERTAALRTIHERLAAADRLAALGTLAAGLGHDMNNLLFPLRCRLDAIDHSAGGALPEAVLGSVRDTVGYLQQIADGLRLLALDPEDPAITEAETDLSGWWKQVGHLLRCAVPRDVEIEAVLKRDLPPVHVAPHQLTQAVLNLVVNASEAQPDGGRIRIDAERRGTFVELRVRDEGCGMTSEVRRRACDPFFTTKKRRLATGLGLTLVHGVARSCDGAIDIESSEGSGTTVIVRLPAVARIGPDEADEADRGSAVVSIADDRERAWICRLLESSGYRVRTGAPDPAADLLWVTDTGASIEPARRFLDAAGSRRLVVIGHDDDPTAPWRELGAVIVSPPGSLDALRNAVR